MPKAMVGFFVNRSKVSGGRDGRDDTTHPHTARDADTYDRHHPRPRPVGYLIVEKAIGGFGCGILTSQDDRLRGVQGPRHSFLLNVIHMPVRRFRIMLLYRVPSPPYLDHQQAGSHMRQACPETQPSGSVPLSHLLCDTLRVVGKE